MTTQITKFQLEERIRRLYFKHRGNVSAVIEETGLDENYVRKVTNRIRKGFKHDVSFQIACHITEAILAGREQRLILLEDRLKEVLSKKEVISICCSSPVSIHTYDDSTWYKCKKCGNNCETMESDGVNDNTVIKIIDRMRREDEYIGKFLAAMGLILNSPDSPTQLQQSQEERSPRDSIQVESKEVLPPAEQKLLEKLNKLDPSEINRIRRLVESEVNRATNDPK